MDSEIKEKLEKVALNKLPEDIQWIEIEIGKLRLLIEKTNYILKNQLTGRKLVILN